MSADHGLHRSGEYPFVLGGLCIVEIQAAAAGVPAVEGIEGGADAIGIRGVVDGAIADGGKRTGLINHARERIGKGCAFHAVESHRRDGDLALIGLAAGFGIYELCQQAVVRSITG